MSWRHLLHVEAEDDAGQIDTDQSRFKVTRTAERQDGEDVYTPLHLVPPSTIGLRTAVSHGQDLTLIYNTC